MQSPLATSAVKPFASGNARLHTWDMGSVALKNVTSRKAFGPSGRGATIEGHPGRWISVSKSVQVTFGPNIELPID